MRLVIAEGEWLNFNRDRQGGLLTTVTFGQKSEGRMGFTPIAIADYPQ